MSPLELHVYHDADELARGAADRIASELSWAIRRHSTASVAFSGGVTPWLMLTALARHPLEWEHIHIFQVDERAVPEGDDARSLTHLRTSLLDAIEIPPDHVHAIPIADELDGTARHYSETLHEFAPDGLDVVHLGLGDDGHTASLAPGDAVLGVTDRMVGVTGEFRGVRRVTLTYPALAAARCVVWLVDGEGKAEMLRRLVAGDDTIPAARVPQDRAVVFCDEAAVGSLGATQ